MKVIGLTGSIGSGKSTVARFLKDLGAIIIDADKIGHQVLKTDSELRQRLVENFGRHILTSTGSIDRGKLAKMVFGDRSLLEMLNGIIHPWIYQIIKNRLEGYREKGTQVVFLEAPLLPREGWNELIDRLWVTTASEDTIMRRLEETRGLPGKEARARLDSRVPVKKQVENADVVIDTDCSLKELGEKVTELWNSINRQDEL
ncbi:MAG: dephospho-CoA kinase [Dehalococcoidales bacterium]